MIKYSLRYIIMTVIMILIIAICFSTGNAFDLCVDPGHGGDHPGALTHITDYDEKDINLQVAQALEDTLEFWGCQTGTDVIYTRLIDTTIFLKRRADIANASEAQYFISIHHNSSNDPNALQGTETWYGTDNIIGDNTCSGGWDDVLRNFKDSLARKVFLRLRDAFHYNERGYKPTGTFIVLNCSYMMSTITEASFISAPYFNLEA